MKHKQILNIIHRIGTNNKYNLPIFAYDPELSLFDIYLYEHLPAQLFSIESYQLPGIGIYGLLSNNPLSIAQNTNNIYRIFDTEPRFLIYHDKTPTGMKKEDKQLMADNLSQYTNISVLKNTDWPINNMVYISYGIPQKDLENNINIDKKNKDVCVLNFNNNQASNIIYNQLKNNNVSVDTIKDLTFNMSDYISIISEYKVVIDVYSSYNRLISLLCGCSVISGINSFEKDYIISTNSISELVEQTKKILISLDVDNNIKNAQILLDKYTNNNFIADFTNLLTKNKLQ